MSMNPFHDFQPLTAEMNVSAGDICILSTRTASPGLYVVAAHEEQQLECYELLPGSRHDSEQNQLYLPFELMGQAGVLVDLSQPVNIQPAQIRQVEARLDDALMEQLLRALVQRQVARYSAFKYQPKAFTKGESSVPVSGKVLGAEELHYLVDASLDGWLTTGRFNREFEQALAEFLGIKHVLTVNSGSSANLLALSALTSPKLGDRALKPGDEVITVAAGFPTTVNPILQNGLVPVFVDISLPGYNIDASQLEAALSDKTRAVMMAHTLGNPFNLDAVVQFARQHGLWLVEDCCDALGTTYTPSTELSDYKGRPIAAGEPRHVGSFGDIATLSFYPAHHITMGEGGAVYTDNGQLKLILESFRDWGRDCFCEPGKDNTCNKRFSYQLGQLPCGYDHKYTYSHCGYNLKISDMQAAVAVAQLKRLPDFIAARKANFKRLYQALRHLSDYLLLPEAEPGSDPSWFGFALTLKQGGRSEFIQYLESHRIANRLVFGGNLVKQPYFADKPFRQAAKLDVTDQVMHDSLWIGLYPGLSEDMIDFMIDTISQFFSDSP